MELHANSEPIRFENCQKSRTLYSRQGGCRSVSSSLIDSLPCEDAGVDRETNLEVFHEDLVAGTNRIMPRRAFERIRTAGPLSVGKAGHRFRNGIPTIHVATRIAESGVAEFRAGGPSLLQHVVLGGRKIDRRCLAQAVARGTASRDCTANAPATSRWPNIGTTANAEEMEIALSAAYESKTARRLPFDIDVEFKDRQGETLVSQTKTVSALPYKDVVSIKDLSEGDWECCVTVISNQVRWKLPSQIVSCTNALEERLTKAKENFESNKSKDPNTQQRSQQLMLNLLRDLKNGRALETDFPAHQLLVTVEQWDNAAGALPRLEGSLLEGQYWLELDGAKSSTVVRVSIPANVVSGTSDKVPVLFAFHGAGGSENMFFDAYGAGEVAALSKKAGYILVCPRQPLMGGVMSVEEMLEQLSQIAPIDTERVAVLGHSMGAAQTISQVERSKAGSIRGAVILGGGRGISKPDLWKIIPVFAGAGERDFGRRGVQLFAASCRKEGGVVREEIYEAIEHLGIVQVALPDVFQWLEPLLQK
jgi:predicted esterase